MVDRLARGRASIPATAPSCRRFLGSGLDDDCGKHALTILSASAKRIRRTAKPYRNGWSHLRISDHSLVGEQGPTAANLGLEPSRLLARANMSLWRAAQAAR